MAHRFRTALRISVCCLAAGAAVALGEPGPTTKADENAAASYQEAFRALPRLVASERQACSCRGNTCGSKLRAAPLTPDLIGPVNRSGTALAKLRAGAARGKCDWGDAGPDDVDRLVRNAKAVLLMKLGAVRAKEHFERGRADAGTADLAAVQTLGHRFGTAGPLVCLPVQNAADALVAEIAAEYLPKLSKASLRGLDRRLKAVPPAADLKGALERERKHVARTHKGSPWLEASLSYYAAAEGLAHLPPDEMGTKLKLKTAGSPVGAALNPLVGHMARSRAEARLKQAMLTAAIQVLLEGTEEIKGQLDPYTKQPLAYQQMGKGFRLKSNTKVNGRPVTLDVGPRP